MEIPNQQVVIVVVELPLTFEDYLRSARQHDEGGRVRYSWCMCVVGHGYDGLSEGKDGGC